MKRLIVICSILMLFTGSAARADIMYQVTDLGPAVGLSGPVGRTDIVLNNNGMVGWTSSAGAMLWDNGIVTNLNEGQVYGISDSGAVVGAFAPTTQNTDQPFLWQSGATHTFLIPTGGGPGSFGVGGIAKGVNSEGLVAGFYYDSPSRPSNDSKAFSYQNGSASDLSLSSWPTYYRVGGFDYNFAHANAINDNGIIVGNVSHHSGSPNDPGKAVAWFNLGSGPTDLGAGLGSKALFISSNDIIVGTVDPGGAWLWEEGQITTLTTSHWFRPTSVNSQGLVFGVNEPIGRLTIWEDGLFTDLPSQIGGYDLIGVAGGSINNLGQIAVFGQLDGGPVEALLLTPILPDPVPEPSSILLLIMGIAALLLFRR